MDEAVSDTSGPGLERPFLMSQAEAACTRLHDGASLLETMVGQGFHNVECSHVEAYRFLSQMMRRDALFLFSIMKRLNPDAPQ